MRRWRTRLADMTEATANTVIGAGISWAATYWALPWLFDLAPSKADAAGITALFFALSLLRGWALRALFRRHWHG